MGIWKSSASDWRRSFGLWRLWVALGNEDILDRYRQSFVGVAWIILSFALFVVVKISVFGQMASVPVAEFGLFVTIGFAIWSYASSAVLDGCTAFLHSRHWILGVNVPYPVYLLQAAFRNLVIFAATVSVVAAALAWKGHVTLLPALSVLPAVAIYVITPLWLSAILAPICARHRDFHHAVQTGIRLLFFVTPILWLPSSSVQLARIAALNPLTHFIEISRTPLLYGYVPLDSWLWVGTITMIGIPAGFATYTLTRRNVVFWV